MLGSERLKTQTALLGLAGSQLSLISKPHVPLRDLFQKQSGWLQRNRAWVWPLGTDLRHTWVFRAGGSGKVCFNRGLRETSQQHWHAALPRPNEELGEVLPSYNLLSADNKAPTWQPVLPEEQREWPRETSVCDVLTCDAAGNPSCACWLWRTGWLISLANFAT